MGATWGTMNVLEAEGRYYCQIALPGIMPDAIELTVRQNTLTVEANVPELLPVDVRKNATYLLREFGAGKFSRSVTFPKDVDGEAVEARSHHGILTIEIPLAQHAQPRRIAVRSGETTSPERQIVDEPAPVGSNSAGHAS